MMLHLTERIVDCHLQMASFSFDVFSGDVVRSLCSGGKLVLCPRELLLAPAELYELMCQEKVDCAAPSSSSSICLSCHLRLLNHKPFSSAIGVFRPYHFVATVLTVET